jgi:TctA family transporter
VPYRFLVPSAVFFICVGVFSAQNNLFDVLIVGAFGVIGAVFMALDFPVSPIVLGYVLGPMLEENFRRALLISRGDLGVFLHRPISAGFVAASALLIALQVVAYLRRLRVPRPTMPAGAPSVEMAAGAE